MGCADLSHVLALHYGLRVVGIDSEESNTRGAQVRTRGDMGEIRGRCAALRQGSTEYQGRT